MMRDTNHNYWRDGGWLVAAGSVLAVWMLVFARILAMTKWPADNAIVSLIFFCLLVMAAVGLWLGNKLIRENSPDGRFRWYLVECLAIGLAAGCLSVSLFHPCSEMIGLTVAFALLGAVIAVGRRFWPRSAATAPNGGN